MSHLRRIASRLFLLAAPAALALVVLTTTTARGQGAADKPAPAADKPVAKGAAAKAAPAAKAAKPGKPVKIVVDVRKELDALSGTDVDAAEAAAKALGATADKGARDGLLDALSLGLHPRVAAEALRSLAANPDGSIYDTVAFYAHYRDGRVRAAAVQASSTIDDSRAVSAVLAALHDVDPQVRAAAADAVARRKLKQGIEPLLALLKKGDDAAAPALASLADPDLARTVGELIGTAPDGLVARCLGMILLKPDLGGDPARLEVVRALGKVPGADAVEQLSSYVAATPEKPAKKSRREAEALIEARLSGEP